MIVGLVFDTYLYSRKFDRIYFDRVKMHYERAHEKYFSLQNKIAIEYPKVCLHILDQYANI